MAGLLLVSQYACKSTNRFGEDAAPPLVSVAVAEPSITADQDFHFVVQASDDVSLLTIRWSVTGLVTKDTLIQFTTTTPSYSQQFTLTDELAAGSLLIVATATDGSGNEAAPDSAVVLVVTN